MINNIYTALEIVRDAIPRARADVVNGSPDESRRLFLEKRISDTLVLPDEETCREAVSAPNAIALNRIPVPLRTRVVCLAAVLRDFRELAETPREIRDSHLCLEALAQSSDAWDFVPDELRAARSFLALAVARNGLALARANTKLVNSNICEIAIRQNARAISFVPTLLRSPALCYLAISLDPDALNLIPNPSSGMCKAAEASRAKWKIPKIL